MPLDDNSDNGRRLTRREMLGAAAAMGASGIAGCGGDGGTPTETEGFTTDPPQRDSPTASSTDTGDGTDTETGTGTADGETWGVEEFIPDPACTPPNDSRFDINQFVPPQDVNVAPNTGLYYYLWFTIQGSIINQWIGWGANDPDFKIPLLYDEFEFTDGGTNWHIHMVEDHAGWHDGTDLHINDFVYNAQYDWKFQNLAGAEPPLVEEFDVQDQYTVDMPLRERRHPGVHLANLQYPTPVHPAPEMEPWWERMMDATSGSQAETINEEYSNLNRSMAEYPDEHVGNGPFMISDITDSFVDLEMWDEHLYASEQNIETLRCHFFAGESAQRLAWEDGIPDHGYPPSNTDLPEKYVSPRYPQIEGGGLNMSQWHDDFARRGFRQAIFHLSNFAGATRASTDQGYPMDHWTGMPTRVARNWIDDWEGFKESLIDYGAQANAEKATSLLEGMGYTQEGGTWVNPDGDTVSFTIGVPTEFQELYGEHALRDQWRNFGFEVEYTVFEEGNWSGYGGGLAEYINPRNGHWDVAPGNRGPDDTNYPYTGCFSDTLHYQGLQVTPQGQTFEDREWNFADRDVEVEIPSEIGVESLDDASDTQTVDIREAQETMVDPRVPLDEIGDLAEQMAWYLNFDMPCNYINMATNAFTGNAEDFHFPDLDGDGRLDNYYTNRLDRGLIRSLCE